MLRSRGMRFLFGQRFAEEAQGVAEENAVNVFGLVTAAREDFFELVDVRDRIDVAWRLFVAETAVQVGAERAVAGVAGDLADVIDVIGRGVDADDFGLSDAAFPAGKKHPRVEDRADDRFALDEQANLVVAELAIAGNERAAVVMTGQNGAVVNFEGFKKRSVGEVRGVENHSDPHEFFQQVAAGWGQRTIDASARGVMTVAVMRWANGAEAVLPPMLNLLRIHDRVRAFHADD